MRFWVILIGLLGGIAEGQVPPDALETARQTATMAYTIDVMTRGRELDGARTDIEALKAMIAMVQDPGQRKALLAQVDVIANRLERLRSVNQTGSRRAARTTVPSSPVSSAALARLENSLRGANSREDKLRVVREAVKTHFFSTNQVPIIMSHFSFGGDRVEAIAAIYPRLTDRENAHGLFELVSSRTDREALEKRLTP